MKIILWIGNDSIQKALANKINSIFPIDGIITETRKHTPKITLSKLFEKAVEKICLPSIGRSWWGMKEYYEKKYPNYPETKLLDVENINSQTAYDFTSELNPDLIIVSGTRLIKEKMLSFKPKIGILNLHTGLSPYIKGGPNCTNWCLATKQFHFIGNTIMWIDPGIDSGNIVTTEFTEFNGYENLSEIHMKVMEHAHALYLKAIGKLSMSAQPGIKQSDIEKGTTYFTKQWGLKEKISLIKNLNTFHKLIRSGELERIKLSVKTIKI